MDNAQKLIEIDKDGLFKKEQNSVGKELKDLILENYHPQYRFIENISVIDNECIAKITVDKYPYAKESAFNYVTSTSFSLIISQVVYVFIAELLRRRFYTNLNKFTLEKFILMRDNGDLLFTKNNFTFKKKLMKNEPFSFRVKMRAMKKMKNFVCASIVVSVENHLQGDAMLVAGPLNKYDI